jgi:hypothetical protein
MMPKDEAITDADQVVFAEQLEHVELERPLRFLSAKEIGMIDEFLATMEDQGELKLVVHKSRLRFVTKTKDIDITDSED